MMMQELVETKANMGQVIELSTQAYEARSIFFDILWPELYWVLNYAEMMPRTRCLH